jgi:hypothetical protein
MFHIFAFKSLSQPYREKELYTIRFAIMHYSKCGHNDSYCSAASQNKVYIYDAWPQYMTILI